MIKNLKKTFFLLFTLSLMLTACQNQKSTGAKDLNRIRIHTERAESVSIYYGSACYSFFSENKETIAQTAGLFKGFSLKEVQDGALDSAAAYEIYFSNEQGQTAAINVDKSGLFYLPETRKYYQVSDGVFHLEKLEKLYHDSMDADGFDISQCLIQ